ncbi:MAG: hypothetical protein IJN13_02545 [Bacilli bacterium]|nr:hypothetical protein [Bacilli bacterium]
MCKKYFKVIITLLLLIEFTFVFLSIKSFNNKDIKEIKEENKVDKEMFSMYVENKDGEYEEYTDCEYYPIGLKYYFNEERSNCTDNKGKVVNDVISYNNNKITVSSNKTLFCYLYFDLDKIPPQTFTFYLGGNTNPEYITSTNTTAYLSWTDNDIESYCINTENNSSSCSWISTTGNSVTPSYTISTQGSNTRYAFIRDAAENISPVVSDVVFLDSVAPVITSASDSGAGTANVTVTETGSGVSHVCVNQSRTSTSGCIWDEVSGTTFTSTTAVTVTSSYYIHVKDKAGNIGHLTSTVSIKALPMNLYKLCSSYPDVRTCMANEYGGRNISAISNLSSYSWSTCNDFHRYEGTDDVVDNNYICFGTNDKSTCTNNQDKYMYRIISINSQGQIKVVKRKDMGQLKWASSNTDRWINSPIYSAINSSTFLTNTTYVPTGWENKIATVTWNYGDKSYYTNQPTSGYSVDAKVGIVSTLDYYCTDEDNIDSWIYSGVYEWSIDRKADGVAWVFNTSNSGLFSAYSSTALKRTYRPVFYLTSDIKITGGTGTIDNPYIIN